MAFSKRSNHVLGYFLPWKCLSDMFPTALGISKRAAASLAWETILMYVVLLA